MSRKCGEILRRRSGTSIPVRKSVEFGCVAVRDLALVNFLGVEKRYITSWLFLG